MDWKEILSKLRLVDMQNSLDTDQAGVVNIKVEKKTYNFYNVTPEQLKRFKLVNFTSESENKIKEDSRKELEHMEATLNLLPDETKTEVVLGSTLNNAVSHAAGSLTVERNDEKE